MSEREVAYENLVLDMLELSSTFSGPAAQNMEFERKQLGRIIRYKLKTMIPAEDVKKQAVVTTFKYPDGWFEALKEQHFPGWLLDRYPVKYKEVSKTVIFTAYHVYPKLPMIMPDYGGARQMILNYVPEEEA